MIVKMTCHLTTKQPEVLEKNEQYFRRKLTLNTKQSAMFDKMFKLSYKKREVSWQKILYRKRNIYSIAEAVI